MNLCIPMIIHCKSLGKARLTLTASTDLADLENHAEQILLCNKSKATFAATNCLCRYFPTPLRDFCLP